MIRFFWASRKGREKIQKSCFSYKYVPSIWGSYVASVNSLWSRFVPSADATSPAVQGSHDLSRTSLHVFLLGRTTFVILAMEYLQFSSGGCENAVATLGS